MPSNLPSLCRFHLRRLWGTRPVAFTVLLAAIAAAFAAAMNYAGQWREAASAAQEWQALSARSRMTEQAAAQPVKAQPVLPPFRGSQLADALNRVAQETRLPLDEILFSLDDNGNLPYLRYRATLSISAGYPAIRRFLDRMRTELADVTLDAISCSREDIGSSALTCELTLSAFYRRGERG
ncbi:MAG TPA: hypothetical protein VEC06_03750 [Paucimonas sp.]|nr:hypothetical protein [Paucimonas sp.]